MERGEKWEGTLGTMGFEGSTILFLHFSVIFSTAVGRGCKGD